MGDTLFGGEKSGTPLETRRGAANMGAWYENAMRQGPGGVAREFSGMTREGMMNMLGFDPMEVGLDEAAIGALMDPRDQTRGLFAAMQPFEEKETARQVAGMREMFGTMGGRFSRNIMEGEAGLRGELGAQFGRNREQALMAAGQMRNNALAQILGAVQGARGQAFQEAFLPWQQANQYLQPGAPVHTEGIMPGLLGAGLNLGAAYLTGGGSLIPQIAGGVAGGVAGGMTGRGRGGPAVDPTVFEAWSRRAGNNLPWGR